MNTSKSASEITTQVISESASQMKSISESKSASFTKSFTKSLISTTNAHKDDQLIESFIESENNKSKLELLDNIVIYTSSDYIIRNKDIIIVYDNAKTAIFYKYYKESFANNYDLWCCDIKYKDQCLTVIIFLYREHIYISVMNELHEQKVKNKKLIINTFHKYLTNLYKSNASSLLDLLNLIFNKRCKFLNESYVGILHNFKERKDYLSAGTYYREDVRLYYANTNEVYHKVAKYLNYDYFILDDRPNMIADKITDCIIFNGIDCKFKNKINNIIPLNCVKYLDGVTSETSLVAQRTDQLLCDLNTENELNRHSIIYHDNVIYKVYDRYQDVDKTLFSVLKYDDELIIATKMFEIKRVSNLAYCILDMCGNDTIKQQYIDFIERNADKIYIQN